MPESKRFHPLMASHMPHFTGHRGKGSASQTGHWAEETSEAYLGEKVCFFHFHVAGATKELTGYA